MLSDEGKRKIYDQFGKAAMDDSAPGMDTVTMLRVLFGGGSFDDIFGEINLITMLQIVSFLPTHSYAHPGRSRAGKDARRRGNVIRGNDDNIKAGSDSNPVVAYLQ